MWCCRLWAGVGGCLGVCLCGWTWARVCGGVPNESYFSVCTVDAVWWWWQLNENPYWYFILFSVFLNAFYMFCEIKGNSQIKLIWLGITSTWYWLILCLVIFLLFSGLSLLLFVASINWIAKTYLIRMCRDLGHRRPRLTSESRVKALFGELKTEVGVVLGWRLPAWSNCGDAAECLIPEKGLLRLSVSRFPGEPF